MGDSRSDKGAFPTKGAVVKTTSRNYACFIITIIAAQHNDLEWIRANDETGITVAHERPDTDVQAHSTHDARAPMEWTRSRPDRRSGNALECD